MVVGFAVDMSGRVFAGLRQWRTREWGMTGLALVVVCLVVFTATRGLAFGDSRVVCGVHWQSDVEAGRVIGAAGCPTTSTMVCCQ